VTFHDQFFKNSVQLFANVAQYVRNIAFQVKLPPDRLFPGKPLPR
jgi:hypothetical protein